MSNVSLNTKPSTQPVSPVISTASSAAGFTRRNEVHLNTRNSTKVSPTIQNRNTVPEKDTTLTALKDWN